MAKRKCKRLGGVSVDLCRMINAGYDLERSLLSNGGCVRLLWGYQICSLCTSLSDWSCCNL